MRILRHSKIAITMELYTMIPDEATLAALKRLSDALGSADAALPDDAEQVPVAVLPGQVFEKRVELRDSNPWPSGCKPCFLRISTSLSVV
jgi:hypothetical protein